MTFRRTTCPHCRIKLDTPHQRIHQACIPGYADAQEAKAMRTAEKQIRAAAKVERADTKRRKEAIKSLPELKKEAERAFNTFIRARDALLPCISCNASPPDLSGLHAGRDAGHYRSVGSAAHLRYHEDNVHAQCVKCNQWDAGRVVDYRIGLVRRIGTDRVVALETNNTPHKWTKDELRAIKADYTARANELKKAMT